MDVDLCRAFQQARGSGDAPDIELAQALAAAVDAGTSAWPDFASRRLEFAAFLGHRIPADVDAIDALSRRAIGELYLVCACLAGDENAQRELEERYLKELPARLIRQNIPQDVAAETVQQLRVRLFVEPRPLLLAYSGTGALRGWLRVAALRAAIRAQRKQRFDRDEDEADAIADAAGDPSLQYQRRLYQEEFRTAFAEAVAALTVRERNLLKQAVLYGATSDDLGALYGIHRATAARWLGAARERLVAETKQRMIVKLGVTGDDYESILRLIRSQLDVSISRVLG